MSGPGADIDARFMQVAVRMAERGLGTTAPNPSVGAVLVGFEQSPLGVVIARGWTQPGGRPHAETQALAAAGEAARGATLYVTLEPCSHHARTPPCAEAVIAAEVARVVVGVTDPDPRVSGRGLAVLRAAGIEVVTGAEAAACRWVTLGHISRVTQRRPMVTLKMALRDDFSVPAGGSGTPNFVTGPEARAAGHLLRAQSDAILVGSGTVRDDDPELTCRLPGLEHRSPTRIVLDSSLTALKRTSKLARTAREVPVWVMTSVEARQEDRTALENAGVRVSVIESVNGRLNLDGVLRLLADDGVTRLMVEGGPRTWRACVESGCVDEAFVFVQRNGVRPLATDGAASFAGLMTLVTQGTIGADGYFCFRRGA